MAYRVEGEQAAGGHRPAGALVGQVQAMVRAVHLERRARSGRLRHHVPVEIEIIPALDLPTGRVGDHVDVRAANRGEDAPGELLAGLAPPDVERGDDDVVLGEEVIVVVERRVGADLELAAVQEPEPFVGRRGRGPAVGLFPLESGIQLGDDGSLDADPVGVRPWAIASDRVWSVRTW